MIGGGDIARHHGRAVVRLGGRVTGVYDVSEQSLAVYTAEFGCPAVAYEEIEDYAAKADYVVISTPPSISMALVRPTMLISTYWSISVPKLSLITLMVSSGPPYTLAALSLCLFL